jgi:hypothetical protein
MKSFRLLLYLSLTGILIIGLPLFLWSRAEANRQVLPQAISAQPAESHYQEYLQGPIDYHENGEPAFEEAIQEEESSPLDATQIGSELMQKIPVVNLKPGWIYREEEHIGNSGMQSPQRGDYPKHYYRVGWYYVNDDGMIEKSVDLDKGIDGDLFQITIYVNGYSWNSFSGGLSEREPYPADILFNDSDLIEWMVRNESESNSSISVYVENPDTDPTYIFVVEEYIPIPVLHPDLGEPFTGSIAEYHFDAETGFMKGSVSWIVLESDGSKQLRQEINYKRVIDAQPPQEILDLIEEYGIAK